MERSPSVVGARVSFSCMALKGALECRGLSVFGSMSVCLAFVARGLKESVGDSRAVVVLPNYEEALKPFVVHRGKVGRLPYEAVATRLCALLLRVRAVRSCLLLRGNLVAMGLSWPQREALSKTGE